MTIKDVELLTDITRQNIRFYEKEGLIAPYRNPENQYREYSMEDVMTLKRIRLYRKLNVSIEDIRKLESRTLSLQSCMEQCISNTEKEMARMAKTKEVCEELKKMDTEGQTVDVEKTLEQINAYEKSGYQFADISKDYWNRKTVLEIRSLNRQAAAALIASFAVSIFCGTLYYLLGEPQWMNLVPGTVIGYAGAWIFWAFRNKTILKKHIRFASAPAVAYLMAAVIGILFYPIISAGAAVTASLFPNALIAAAKHLENSMTAGASVWLSVLLLFRNVLYSLIACILFYDTFKQRSIVSALGFGAVLFALTCMNPYTAVTYVMIGICMIILYELTDSAVIGVMPIFIQTLCSFVLSIAELYFPGVIPEIFAARGPSPLRQLFPWLLLSVLLILILLYAVSCITGRTIDWKQEWEKEKTFFVPAAEDVTVMDREAFRGIEKERKRSYRLMDGYLLTAIILTLWVMTANLF